MKVVKLEEETKQKWRCNATLMESNAQCNAMQHATSLISTALSYGFRASCKGMKELVAADANQHDAIARHQYNCHGRQILSPAEQQELSSQQAEVNAQMQCRLIMHACKNTRTRLMLAKSSFIRHRVYRMKSTLRPTSRAAFK